MTMPPALPPDPRITDNNAIQELIETLQDLEESKMDPIERILAAIGSMPEVDPLNKGDEPHNWKEAQESPDAEKWKKGYLEELQGLKELGIYKLVPRSQVPEGTKI